MASSIQTSPVSSVLRLLILLLMAVGYATGLNIAYCSSENTGSSFSPVTNLYQSNGACFETCKATYAFAIVQGSMCWCSDYTPADTMSTASCDEICPGFGSERCGSTSKGLFGYIALNKSPVGIAGGTSSAEASGSPSTNPDNVQGSSTVTSSAAPSPVTVLQTVTASPLVETSIVSIVPSTSATATTTSQQSSQQTSTSSVISVIPIPVTYPATSSTTPSSSTPSTTDTSSWSPTPVTSLLTVTGQVITITITPTQPPRATTTAQPVSSTSGGGFFSHAGKVAGLIVGLILLIIIVTAGAVLFCVRRYHRRPITPAAESEPDDDTPQRRPSRMSQMGLIAGGRGPLGEKVLSSIQTSDWGPSSSTKSPDTTSSALDKRRSFPLVVDQRLDPGTLWSPHHDNDSRISIKSLQDDQDYSRRMLRVANPDH